MDALFLTLLNRSVAAGWLVLVVLLLRPLLRRAPKTVRCVLWGLCGIRLLCPVLPQSGWSLVLSVHTVPVTSLYAQQPIIHTGIAALNYAVNPVISQSLAPQVGDSVNPMQVIATIAGWVWIAGVAAMLCYVAVSFWRLHRQTAAAIRLQDDVWICDAVDTPFLLGLFRPRILLPSQMDEAARGYAIAHERAHLARRDHWWKPLGFLLLAVYWFHPLMWVGYILLCRDIELACDERVVRFMDAAEKKAYSVALLSCSLPKTSLAACPLAFGEVGVKGRIRSVLQYKKPAFWLVLVAVLCCVVVAACFLTDPKHESEVGGFDPPRSYTVEGGGEVAMYDTEEWCVYTLQGDDLPELEQIIRPSVLLSRTGDAFQFSYSMLSSHIGMGWYERDGDRLTLHGYDGTCVYSFFVAGNDLVFDATNSTTLPSYRYSGQSDKAEQPVKNGAVFASWTDQPVPFPQSTAAVWTSNAALSATFWHWFRFEVAMPYDRIEVSCSTGQLEDADTPYPGEISRGQALILPPEHAIYWLPTDIESDEETPILLFFTIYQNDTAAFQGVLYLTAREADGLEQTYTARLHASGLTLEQGEWGGVIRCAGSESE